MADLEFDSAQLQESDPAADFLQKEQGALAELGDDDLAFDGGASAPTQDFSAELDQFGQKQEQSTESNAYSAIQEADVLATESEAVRKWREDQKQVLEEKDEQAEVERQQWLEQAKQDLQDWEARQAEQLEKAKSDNRAAEEAFIRERDEDTPGSEWERVARFCDFNPKNSKSTKDAARMRSILLHLKQTPLVR
ncbi:clathrin light chain B-like isoform X1 [Sycon ciliatum]|uniref:clathrin light chain B-like isoform X1 n=1 Tax=Sycon ciliatum TaxID=27933 RepID=UPI0031F603D7|eukprot:scpid88031/ scgid9911/ Clathrin light chain B